MLSKNEKQKTAMNKAGVIFKRLNEDRSRIVFLLVSIMLEITMNSDEIMSREEMILLGIKSLKPKNEMNKGPHS
ncbi:hypothetical protein KY46_03960 [Photobacterium halotolerans]|uniref:Uncharacterized protein n=1 Tax=Photobacterium halotolerans TaxID=265726 RepID=A0A0F5VFI6_9GAMM|nr:hypothetical protein KY46_03960 [Photobacterium halotolerans]